MISVYIRFLSDFIFSHDIKFTYGLINPKYMALGQIQHPPSALELNTQLNSTWISNRYHEFAKSTTCPWTHTITLAYLP